MNTYLREARKFLALSVRVELWNTPIKIILSQQSFISISKEPLVFVIGNESCDLDSAVSAISLAYFHAKAGVQTSVYRDKYRVLPLMNISRVNLPLKTEVTYFLQRNGIELKNVICR